MVLCIMVDVGGYHTCVQVTPSGGGGGAGLQNTEVEHVECKQDLLMYAH